MCCEEAAPAAVGFGQQHELAAESLAGADIYAQPGGNLSLDAGDARELLTAIMAG